jgi:hypothetical protein
MRPLRTLTRWSPTAFLLIFGILYGQLGCASSAHALDASGGGTSVTLVDAWGRELPTYRHRGSTYVLGAVGDRYGVRIRNRTSQRVEVVVSVDGRDVLTGDVGDWKHQRGYIVNPWQTVTIDGFRKSMQEVAAFRFTSPGDSYTSRRGTPQHVGVIGVAVFSEQRVAQRPVTPTPRPHPYPYRGDWDRSREGWADEDAEAPVKDLDGSADAPAPTGAGRGGAGSSTAESRAPARRAQKHNIGTQYGETRHSSVVEVPFVRARPHNPDRLLGLYYDDARGLRARGIRIEPAVSGEPDPFPGARRFAPPPP